MIVPTNVTILKYNLVFGITPCNKSSYKMIISLSVHTPPTPSVMEPELKPVPQSVLSSAICILYTLTYYKNQIYMEKQACGNRDEAGNRMTATLCVGLIRC